VGPSTVASRAAPAGAFLVRALNRPIVTGARTRMYELVLIAWFTTLTMKVLVYPQIIIPAHPIGVDAVVYTHAARALLAGGDPWFQSFSDIFYAAPPPSLLPFLPLVWLPDEAIAWLGASVALLCGIYALRRLRMPLWWLLFPPVAIAIYTGGTALPVLALLIRGGAVADGLAVVGRVYAALPLVALGRWRGLVIAAVLLLVSAPFVGWPIYLGELAHVREIFAVQAGDGVSWTAVPILLPWVLLMLVLIGRRRAAWLLVPMLWPSAQHYYLSIALPVLAEMPLVAAGFAPYSALAGVLGLTAHVAVERLAPRVRASQGMSGTQIRS